MTTDDISAQSGQRAARPRFHLIYFALALFDLLAVCLGLFLIDRLTHVHRQSVQASQDWGHRLEASAELMQLAAAVDAPGNEIFDSRDIEGESRRLDESLAAFDRRADELRQELSRNLDSADAGTLLKRLDSLELAMARLVSEARTILELFRHEDLQAAGERMAAMDRQFVQVIGALSDFGVEVGRLQRAHFQRQIATADTWRKLEYVVAGLIVLMVVGVTLYGQALSRRMNRAAQELADYRAHLEEMVDARTAELKATHEQLRQADRLASIGTLAAGLGHDMNNVLLPIRARLDAIGAGLSAEGKEHAEAIRRSLAYLQQLSDGLHLLALDPEDSEASGLATNVGEWWRQIGSLMTKAAPKRIAFQVDLPTDLPEIAVPPHRLTQAILNLVVNSGEAIRGEGIIRIWGRDVAEAGVVRIGVTDSGEGMTEAVRRQALDPFFTTKKRGLGTGLGLSLVRGVAQAAGGSVSIESAPGKGTTVTLDLPTFQRSDVSPTARPNGQRSALITIRDRRAATYVSSLLQTARFVVRHGDVDDEEGSRLWILDPGAVSVDSARRFLQADASRRIILFGPHGEQWSSLGAATIEDPTDFEQLRDTLAEVLQAISGPA